MALKQLEVFICIMASDVDFQIDFKSSSQGYRRHGNRALPQFNHHIGIGGRSTVYIFGDYLLTGCVAWYTPCRNQLHNRQYVCEYSNPTAACVCCMFFLICLRSPFQRGERPLPMAGLLGRWKVRVPGGLDEVALQQESYKKADHATWSKESIQIRCMVRERQGELIGRFVEVLAVNAL